MNKKIASDPPPFVLVVDDDPSILTSLELLLKNRGCRVSAASTGKEGLERALQEKPDVILLDVMLPDTDGFDVCRRLKQDPTMRHVPVLMLTALNDLFNKVKGLDAGADDFISKPFNEGELRARVWAFFRTKRLHDELDESYRRLKELEQLRDSLTHMIMHDLVAPLTAIQIGVEAVLQKIKARVPMTDGHQRMLKTAYDGCRRLMDMLRDVLSVSRLEEKRLPLDLKKTNLRSVIESSLSMLEPSRDLAQVSFETKFATDLPPVRCDAGLIGRVIVNLVSNSVKFTEPEGTVTVSASKAGTRVEIEVQDTGLGIPAQDLEKIFDKFFQAGSAASARKGQGLGLTFCRLAVEAHGGWIKAESEVGKGSRFRISLPIEGKAD